MSKCRSPVVVWQWNCRGFTRKRHNLQQLISTEATPPALIAIQEPGKHIKLTGYQSFHTPNNPYTAVLVQRNIPADHHVFDSISIPHDLVVLYPPKRTASRLYVLNVYSSPKAHTHNFSNLLTLTKRAAAHHPLIILGDFNAPHTTWGYTRTTKKGRLLWELVQARRLAVESDPTVPTRIGNSAQTDTSPDLTLSHRVKELKWHCTPHTLGSDHFIIQSTLQLDTSLAPRLRQTHITDWPAFRETCQGQEPPDDDMSVQSWLSRLIDIVSASDCRASFIVFPPFICHQCIVFVFLPRPFIISTSSPGRGTLDHHHRGLKSLLGFGLLLAE